MKILTINPIDGRKNLIDGYGVSGFSIKKVTSDKKITIPENHQMIVHEEIEILGDLEIDGEVVII